MVGVAVTTDPVEELNVAEGVQVYVDAPDAVSVELPPPEHIAVVLGTTVMTGNGFTVKVTVAGVKLLQPAALVPVTL